MRTLRFLAQCGIGAAVMLGSSAFAQYFPQPPYGGNYPPPPRPYYEQDRPYYQPRPDYGYRRRVQLGYACYTSRGTCGLDNGAPLNSACRCFLPGVGKKRGVVVNQ